MRRLFPAPWLSVMLAVLWLVLNQSVSPGQVLLAVAVAVFIPVATRGLRPQRVRLRSPWVAVRLLLVVLVDLVVANLQVALQLAGPRRRLPRGGFVVMPLDARDGNVLAVLSIILTYSPGTVWAELALDRSAVLIHLFDSRDSDRAVARIKQRYERPLMEIFE
jgi:multicomponent K+:H+ antiporter subunit E